MFTLILAFFHSRATNKDFEPDDLYVGTFLLDLILIVGIVNAIGG